MKKVLTCLAVLCMMVIGTHAQKTTKAPVKTPAKNVTAAKPVVMKNLLDSFSYAAGFNVATNMKNQGIKNMNIAIMQRAIEDVFRNNKAALTPEEANACMDRQLQVISKEMDKEEKARGEAFLEKNKKRKEVISVANGLQYEVITSGDANGVHPGPNDTVVVNYIAYLINEKEVDNSYKKGAPAAFPVMGVIKGWSQVLQLMKPGDRWKVYMPTELCYDSGGNGEIIPPYAAMMFDMKLEEIRPFVEKPKNGQ